jgi:hypothetical protein
LAETGVAFLQQNHETARLHDFERKCVGIAARSAQGQAAAYGVILAETVSALLE